MCGCSVSGVGAEAAPMCTHSSGDPGLAGKRVFKEVSSQ